MMKCKNIQKGWTTSLLLLVCCMLTGCTTPFKKYDPSKGLDGDQAIIALNVSEQIVRIKKFDENYNDTNAKSTEYLIGARGFLKTDYSFKDAFYVIETGIYYISDAITTVGGYNCTTTYQTNLPGLTPEGVVVYGAFEVKPGEVAFLGNLNSSLVTASSTDELFKISGNLEEAKEEILNSRSKYKPLVPKLRRTTFYPRGSRIYIDKGIYKLSAPR